MKENVPSQQQHQRATLHCRHAAIGDCQVHHPMNKNICKVLQVSFKQGYFQSITTIISITLPVLNKNTFNVLQVLHLNKDTFKVFQVLQVLLWQIGLTEDFLFFNPSL